MEAINATTLEDQPMIIDANQWLRSMRLPHWALNQFREMRVGDELPLVDYEGPGLSESEPGRAVVVLRRGRGYFELDAGWLIHIGRNSQIRGHLWCDARFKILPGRKLELLSTKSAPQDVDLRAQCMRQVTLVMRRSAILAGWAKAAGSGKSFSTMHPAGFASRNIKGNGPEHVEFLEAMRAPDLSGHKVRRSAVSAVNFRPAHSS